MPDPPRGSRFRRSYLKAPLNKYSCQYEHPSKNLSYAHDMLCNYASLNNGNRNLQHFVIKGEYFVMKTV